MSRKICGNNITEYGASEIKVKQVFTVGDGTTGTLNFAIDAATGVADIKINNTSNIKVNESDGAYLQVSQDMVAQKLEGNIIIKNAATGNTREFYEDAGVLKYKNNAGTVKLITVT